MVHPIIYKIFVCNTIRRENFSKQSMKNIFIAAFVTFLSFQTAASVNETISEAGIYSGYIGKKEATLCIDGNLEGGRYFYQEYGIDIPLQIKRKGGNFFTFDETNFHDESVNTKWSVTLSHDEIHGKLTTQKKPKGEPVFFKLKQRFKSKDTLSNSECEPDLDFKNALKSFYVRKKIERQYRQTKLTQSGATKVEELYEPVSKTKWVRLVEHPNANVQKKLNALFDFQFKEKIFRALDCTSITNMSNAPLGTIEQDAKIIFFTEKILSVEDRVFGDCGGAHPFGGGTGISFDLKKGTQITRDKIFKKDFYSQEQFTDKFKDFLINYFSNSKEENRQMAECFKNDVFLDAWLDKSGIWFSGNNYRAVTCGEPFFISYRSLHETLNDLSPFGLDVSK